MGIFSRKKKEIKRREEDTSKDKKQTDANTNESQDEKAGSEALTAVFSEALAKSSKSSNRLLLVSMIFFALVIGGYGFMSFQMSMKVESLRDNMQATVDKVESLNEIIKSLTDTQGEFTNQQQALGQAVATAESRVVELKTDLPNAAAMRVSKETDKVVAQVRSLSQIVAKQGKDISRATKIIDGLSNQLESFESQLIGAEKLNEDVAALVTLEREKYLEVLQRQTELQEQQKGPDPIKVPRDPNLIFYSIQSAK